jgi:hypothetical protein
MHKVLVWLGIAFFFLVIAALVLFAFLRPGASPGTQQTTGGGFTQGTIVGTTGTTAAAPAQFTEQFYAWYLSHLAHDYSFATSPAFAQDLSVWATPAFVASYPELVKQDEIDPIIFSQDYLSSWLSNINATVRTQSDTAADVIVTLGVSADAKKLEVNLVKGADGWKVASIAKVK